MARILFPSKDNSLKDLYEEKTTKSCKNKLTNQYITTLHSIFHCRLVCFSTCLTFSLYNVFKKSESDFFGSNFFSSHDMFLYSKAFCCHHFHWSCLFIKILLFYFVVFFINQNIFKYKLISELYLVFSFKVVNKQKYLLFNTTLKLNTSLFWLKQ